MLERLGATERRNLEPSEQVAQLCLMRLPKFVYDLALLRLLVLRNGILLAMNVLEAARLRFESLQLRDSISAQTGYARGGQVVFAMLVMQGLLHFVSTKRKTNAC